MEISSAWVAQNMKVVLTAFVIPVLAFLVFIGFRLGKGYYTAGLDALAGVAGMDLGALGSADELRGLLRGPLQGLETPVFISLGLLGITLFAFLSPVERALINYSAQQMGAPHVGASSGFPYVRLFFSWVLVSALLALNILLLTAKFGQ